MTRRKETGQQGEQLAIHYLRERNFTIEQTNWRCNLGEIDIVARDEKNLIFIEVRTRHSQTTDTAFESITPRKREKLIQLAHQYLDTHYANKDTTWRIDIIAVALTQGRKPIIEHIEDALGW